MEQLTLKALGLHGWLTAGQLARWAQGDSRSAFVMQQRVLKRLLEQGLVSKRSDRIRRHCYFLSRVGAEHLKRLIPEAKWHHGYDLSLNTGARHDTAFEECLLARRAGHESLGNAGIRAYAIDEFLHADFLICTEVENIGMKVLHNGTGKCIPIKPKRQS